MKKNYIIYAHEKSVEVECGYNPTEIGIGGNFGGACHGKDQAVRISTYPKIIMHIWDFM